MASSLTEDNLFPTTVYHTFLEDFAFLNVYTKSRLYSLRDRERGAADRPAIRHSGTWHSVSNMHEMEEFRLLRENMLSVVTTVVGNSFQQKGTRPWCTCMRASISDRFGYDTVTPNPNSFLSGIYYVQTPAESGGIEFQDPRSGVSDGSSVVGAGVLYPAAAGQLIVFPSWLPQKVHPNRSVLKGSEGELVSIRFGFGIASENFSEPG